jgi:hypothetical protein
MAFMLPLALGFGSVSGFAVGYYFASDPISDPKNKNNVSINTCITETELKRLKDQSPHLDELIKFDKKKLKKSDSKVNIAQLTDEHKMMENIRQKILNRRSAIDPISDS